MLVGVQPGPRLRALPWGGVASSIALNIAEGYVSDPGNQRSRFFTAAGSASETRAALRVASGWRYIAAADAARAHALLNRIIAILWKLTHR